MALTTYIPQTQYTEKPMARTVEDWQTKFFEAEASHTEREGMLC